MEDQRFVIITPAYNCADKIIRTAMSVIGQTYQNWHWVVCDDMSTDNTSQVILDVCKSNLVSNKLTLINRREKYGEVRNTLEETEKLNPEDIVVRLDAGDFITDLGCLEILNNLYKNYDPAVLWTAHRWSFTNKNISGPIDMNINVYHQPWRSSHLKTYRVKDFLGINKKNYLDKEGDYIMIACDQAIFLPMMERARRANRPLAFYDSVMYHYDINLEDPELFTKDRSIDQKCSAEWIRNRGYVE